MILPSPPICSFKFNTYRPYRGLLPAKTTKRKVDLLSSHSDNERDNGPLAAYSLEGSPADDLLLHKNRGIPAFLRYRPRDGEQVIDEYYYVPPDD